MNTAEAIIWEQIQQKDILAFESFYKKHYKEFLLLAYRYLKSYAPAEEIVNDVFVKIWEDAEKITIESSFKSYICRAVINRSINALNRQKKEIQNQRELASLPEAHQEQREIEANELKVQLYKAIDALPEQCRRVFLMSRSDGMKQQEIADQLGISIKTVKNHITHALKQLGKARGYYVFLAILLLKEIFSFINRAISHFLCLIIVMYGFFA